MTLKPSVVEFLEIDPTTRCNFTCSYCRGRAMPQEDLAPGLLDAALDLFPDVRFVELHGEGEPLLHPDLFGLAERVRARGARVSMYTNGSLLSPAHVERLLDVGFEKVVVSVDSASPARFRELRTGKLDVELGLDGGIGYQPINPGRSYVVNYPEALREQIAPLAELERHVQAVRTDPVAAEAFRGTSSHRGFFDALFEPIARGERVCPWLERGVYVTTRGFVTPCCMLHEPWAIGRVGETDLSTIVSRRDDMRASLARGDIPTPCEGCEVAALVVARRDDVGSDEAEAQAVAVALEAARREIEALRSSWSWRLTAPLRLAYELLWLRR